MLLFPTMFPNYASLPDYVSLPNYASLPDDVSLPDNGASVLARRKNDAKLSGRDKLHRAPFGTAFLPFLRAPWHSSDTHGVLPLGGGGGQGHRP